MRALLALAALLPLAAPAAAEDLSFRVVRTAVAPWVEAGAVVPETVPVGAALTLSGGHLVAPAGIDCDDAVAERIDAVAEDLFEGNLPEPAVAASEAIGLAPPFAILRVACDNASLDLAVADRETVLLAIDNRILTLSATPGTRAADDTPEGAAQRFLEAHMALDMGFWPETVTWKAEFMSPRLAGLAAAYFTVPRPADEVPPVDGDPFTGSQEYPTRFAVGPATTGDGTAEVTVRFADAHRVRPLTYRLVRIDGRWRVDDVVYDDGAHLSDLLQQ